MALEALPELFGRDIFCDLGGPDPADLHLEQVEDVAIQDELDLGRGPRGPVVMGEELGEPIVVEEVLEQVDLTDPGARSQMEIAEDDTNQLHGPELRAGERRLTRSDDTADPRGIGALT